MLVHGRSWRYGVPGRRSRSGERSRPGREGRHEHLRSWGPVAQRGMRPNRIVMASPALDDDLSFSEWVEDLAIQQLVPQTSVTPMVRSASATGVPCETRTSTWRSLDTISSGVCLFLRSVILRLALVSHTSGRTTARGADQPRSRMLATQSMLTPLLKC